jgi:hypothetical protein
MGRDVVDHGIGSLLMTDPNLPRDEFGWPYQPLFYFEGERITGLVHDSDGDIMAYRNTAEGAPLMDESTWQRAPDAIAAAAVEWWEEWQRATRRTRPGDVLRPPTGRETSVSFRETSAHLGHYACAEIPKPTSGATAGQR